MEPMIGLATGLRRLRCGLPVLVAAIGLAGCSAGYYLQAVTGHLRIMQQRRPVSEVLAEPDVPVEVRKRLRTAMEALEFAHDRLGLPDNGSYRQYVDLRREFAVWNVVAAPEFSLQPLRWCFPVAGCVSYRGYFDEQAARRFAARLAARGNDVFVGGVAAYSTLGRFADPLLNTMIGMSDDRLAGLIFHELAHQLLYVKHDPMFNEGFASFIEREGLRRWFEQRGDRAARCRLARRLNYRSRVDDVLDRGRQRLAELYASGLPVAARRARKAALIDAIVAEYRALGGQAPGVDGTVNNAWLAALATYEEYVPAFRAMLAEAGGKLDAFYLRAQRLAALAPADRGAEIARLRRSDAGPAGDSCPAVSGP